MSIITINKGKEEYENNRVVDLIRKFNVPFLISEESEELTLTVGTKRLTCCEIFSMPTKQLEDLLGYKMISVSEAKEIVNSNGLCKEENVFIGDIKPDTVTVSKSIKSSVDHPSVSTSMRDGYGWNTKWNKNVKLILKDVNIYAESKEEYSFKENETCYITTGGKVPSSFDCIIMIENVVKHCFEDGNYLSVTTYPTKSGQFIRAVGSDIKKDEVLVTKGTLLSSYHLALLMSAGIKHVPSYATNICVFSTGNELIDFTEEKGIVDINLPTIVNRLNTLTNVTKGGIIKDDLNLMIDTFNSVKEHIIISSGGASVGEHDYTKMALLKLGYTILFSKINMMPGKPFTFAVKRSEEGNSFFFSLPGNPVAACVLTELFIVPFIKKMNGVEKYENDVVKAIIDFDVNVNSSDPRPDYQRVYLVRKGGNIIARTTGQQTSSTIKSMCGADGIVCVDRQIKKGEVVDVILISKLKRIKEEKEECIKEDEVKKEDKKGTLKIGVLTASDRASKGVYEDVSGKNIMDYLDKEYGKDKYEIVYKVLPDEIEEIKKMLLSMCNEGCCLILTTGGSGPSVRDVTTLATLEVIDKELPGFGEEMRRVSLKYVPTAILSGQTAGIKYTNVVSMESRERSERETKVVSEKRGCLIVNLPGSPRSITECLDAVFPAIPYCIELMGWEWTETKSGWKPKGK